MKQCSDETPTLEMLQRVLESFRGKQLQLPPMFSAKKVNGQRLYKLARQGKVVERQPSEIEIYDIKMVEYSWPRLKIEVTCSAGTYIRTLANDIGEKLGTGAYCEELVRTRIGEYKIEDAEEIEK
jgi:tRNA pseudouridine(55) synthase